MKTSSEVIHSLSKKRLKLWDECVPIWHNDWKPFVPNYHSARESCVCKTPIRVLQRTRWHAVWVYVCFWKYTKVLLAQLHSPLPCSFLPKTDTWLLFWLSLSAYSQGSLPYWFPEHFFQIKYTPKFVSVLPLKKKLHSFPCMYNVFFIYHL